MKKEKRKKETTKMIKLSLYVCKINLLLLLLLLSIIILYYYYMVLTI